MFKSGPEKIIKQELALCSGENIKMGDQSIHCQVCSLLAESHLIKAPIGKARRVILTCHRGLLKSICTFTFFICIFYSLK